MPSDIDPCLINPKRGRNEEPLPPEAILVFSPEDLGLFLRSFPEHPGRTHGLYLSQVFTGSLDSIRVAVAGPMLGAPQTVLVLEKMIALGARRIIAAGWCGSLQKDVRIGDVVIPSSAIAEEGTSGHYPVDAPAPSPALRHALGAALSNAGLPVHEGPVWTTDAPFRETVAKVKRFQSEGVLAVEMEASALFAVSRFRHVDLAVVLVVSDDLSDLRWVHGFRDPRFAASRKAVVESALKALVSAARTSTGS